MKELLENSFSFEKISLVQLRELLGLIVGTQKRDLGYLKERYERAAQNFEDTVRFLSMVGLVHESGGVLETALDSTDRTEKNLKQLVLDALFKSSKRSLAEFNEYLENFIESEGKYSFQPSLNVNLNTSGLRNLLIQLGFLEYNLQTNEYVVSDVGAAYLRRRQKTLSARSLSTILRNQERLGALAEEAVLAYESKALESTPELKDLIEHVAIDDVGAGYDIHSVRAVAGGRYEDRYIEVKAVSSDHDFYWSLNELNTAKTLGTKYYLYLVPVLSGGAFDLENLVIICDPYHSLFEIAENRDVESVSFHISPRESFLKGIKITT